MKKSNQLIWIRSDRKKADVWLAHRDGKHEMKWIENIDVPEWYYEKWNWGNVISVKKKKMCLKDHFRHVFIIIYVFYLAFSLGCFPDAFCSVHLLLVFHAVYLKIIRVTHFISLLSFRPNYYNHLGG